MNAMLFAGHKIPPRERSAVTRWIARRQGLPGAYGDTFAGFPSERAGGIVVFTGERMTSASARHILGEETCRVLRKLQIEDATVRAALERADAGLLQCLERAARDPRNTNPGRYCCGKCTVAMWRNLLAGNLNRHEERLCAGVEHLAAMRKGAGRWSAFPFWYTVLALSEMDVRGAARELTYARPILERTARRVTSSKGSAERRFELARRALERI